MIQLDLVFTRSNALKYAFEGVEGKKAQREESKKKRRKGGAEMMDYRKAFWEGLSTRSSGSATVKKNMLSLLGHV